jgi:hypothetical protein
MLPELPAVLAGAHHRGWLWKDGQLDRHRLTPCSRIAISSSDRSTPVGAARAVPQRSSDLHSWKDVPNGCRKGQEVSADRPGGSGRPDRERHHWLPGGGRGLLKGKVMEALGVESEIEDIRVGWSRVDVEGLRIKGPRASPTADTLRAERVVIVPSLRSVLSRQIEIQSITIIKPHPSALHRGELRPGRGPQQSPVLAEPSARVGIFHGGKPRGEPRRGGHRRGSAGAGRPRAREAPCGGSSGARISAS